MTAVLVAVALLLAAILKLIGILGKVWITIKPLVMLLVFLGTAVIPIGIIIWIVLYRAAENSNRLSEPLVFLSLVFQATALISLYTIAWGCWVCPRLWRLLWKKGWKLHQSVQDNQTNLTKKQRPRANSPNDQEHE